MLNSNCKTNNIKTYVEPKAGEIWWAEIPNAIGSQQGGKHPVLIASNNVYNDKSSMTWAFPITSQVQKKSPVHVYLPKNEVDGLYKDSMIEIESIWNLNKFQLIKKVGNLPKIKAKEVSKKISIQCPFVGCNLTRLIKS